MEIILGAAVIVLTLFLLGWLSFTKGRDRSSITIETEEIRRETRRAKEKGRELAEKASHHRNGADRMGESSGEDRELRQFDEDPGNSTRKEEPRISRR